MKAPIAGCTVVGAMLPPGGKACFDEADVVVKSGASILRVREFLESEVSGDEYTDENWRDFIADHQATPLQVDETSLKIGTVLWALRSDFQGRDAALRTLRASGALVHPVIEGDANAKLCLVCRPRAQALRDEWASVAYETALGHAQAGCWAECLRCAEQAFLLWPELAERELALLIVAYEKTGRAARGEGYLEMAENSKGATFRSVVEAHKEALLASLAPALPGIASGRAWSPWRESQRKHLIAGLATAEKHAA